MFRIVKRMYRIPGFYQIKVDGETWKVDPDHIDYWRRVERGDWEPYTFKILAKFLNEDSVYCDVGSWIGPTVMYAARNCKSVICFEPDPVAYKYLCWNLELNKLNNVIMSNLAIATASKIQAMASFGGKLGDTTTSLIAQGSGDNQVRVLTISWDEMIKLSGIGKIDVLKIDIEGAEFDLIPSIKPYLEQYKPVVYLSTHQQFLKEGDRVAKTQKIMDVMSIYKNCYNRELQPININEMLSESAFQRGQEFVFTD